MPRLLMGSASWMRRLSTAIPSFESASATSPEVTEPYSMSPSPTFRTIVSDSAWILPDSASVSSFSFDRRTTYRRFSLSMNLSFSSQNLQNFFFRKRNFFLYCFLRPRSCPRPPDSLDSLIVSPVTRSGRHQRLDQRVVALRPRPHHRGRSELKLVLHPHRHVADDSLVHPEPPVHLLDQRGGTFEGHQHVDPLLVVMDRIGQPALAPFLDLQHLPAGRCHDLLEPLDELVDLLVRVDRIADENRLVL